MSHWNSIGWVERVVLGSGVFEVGVCTDVMRGVRSFAILESWRWRRTAWRRASVLDCWSSILLGFGVLVPLCWPGWQLAHEEGLRGAGLLLVYVRDHVESSFGLAPPFVGFAALP